ncbi:MAG TPA: hypothetical protein VF806_00975 [Anaerolineaceae bacterium]
MSYAETVIQSQPGKFGLWPSVLKLLRLRVRIWWNALKRAKLRAKIGTAVIAVLIVGGMAFLFFVSALLLRFVQSPELAKYVDPSSFLNAIPTVVLTGAFILTLMTNFGVLLQALYLSHDMDFLVTSPLPMRAVFLAKLLEAILPNFALFCAFSLPVLFGLGISSRYTILYYPFLLMLLLALALAAGGLASILVMAVVRVVPARRVAEVLGVLGALASILCGQSGNLINAMRPNQADVGSALGMLSQLNSPWSPLAWAGRGAVSIGHGEWLAGVGLSLLSLALASAIFGGTLWLAEQLFYTGWSSMQGSVRRKRVPRIARATDVAPAATAAPATASAAPAVFPGAAAAGSVLPAVNVQHAPRRLRGPLRGLIVKDLLLLRRDPRNISQVITPLIVGFVMLFSTRGFGPQRRDPAEMLSSFGLSNVASYGVILLAVFVGWMLMFNLATMAFSREGKNYWLLKSAPLGPRQLLSAKYIVSYLPSALFSLAYLVAAFAIRGLGWGFLPYAALVVLATMAGATGISLAFGAAGANLVWDSPQRQRLSGSMGCVASLAVAGYQALSLGLFILPPALWQIFAHASPLLAYLIGGLLGVSAAAAGAVVPLVLVAPRLGRIGEAE